MKGYSGKLKTTVIGDYLKHQELNILESERQQYYEDKAKDEERKRLEAEAAAKAKKPIVQQTVSVEEKKKALEYIPVDFDAYSILDRNTKERRDAIDLTHPIPDDEKIWRISSLTTFVDDETKILIMPLPESKRKVRIQDT